MTWVHLFYDDDVFNLYKYIFCIKVLFDKMFINMQIFNNYFIGGGGNLKLYIYIYIYI